MSSIYVPARFCRALSRARARALCRTHHSVSRSSAPSRASCSCFSSAALSRASCVCGMCEKSEARARDAEGAIVRERGRAGALSPARACVCVCARALSRASYVCGMWEMREARHGGIGGDEESLMLDRQEESERARSRVCALTPAICLQTSSACCSRCWRAASCIA